MDKEEYKHGGVITDVSVVSLCDHSSGSSSRDWSWALVGNVAGPRVVTVETMLCPTLSLFADCILAA